MRSLRYLHENRAAARGIFDHPCKTTFATQSGVKPTLRSSRSENEGKLTCSGHAHSRHSSPVCPEVSFRVFKELLLKEKALTIARAFKSGRDSIFGELDRFPLLNRKRAFVIRHHIGRID